jgi:glycosyltransferase involved in cell wall biosynthesis
MVLGAALHARNFLKADRYLVASRFMADYLSGVGVPPQKINVRPNAVVDRSSTEPRRPKTLCFVGRLEPAKGIDILLTAWSSLNRPEWTLEIAGNGELSRQVADFAERHENASFRGLLSPAETNDLIASATATVVPSQWSEPFGRVVVESFSHSTPVIATRSGGIAELVDEHVGVPVGLGVEALAAGLDNFLNLADPARIAMGRSARRRYLEHFTPQRNLDILEETYRSSIEELRRWL